MKSRIVLIFFLLFLVPFILRATHIVGGEMTYRYLTGNQYEIHLTVYRDCFNGEPEFDNPAAIGFFNGSNVLDTMMSVSIINYGSVPNEINSPCVEPPNNICYEFAEYIFIATIPLSGGPHTIAYQRCCRNSSIVNVANVQHTGATYFTVIPDTSVILHNSSPVFNDLPSTFLCTDVPFTFNHSATDPDGDSLVYSMVVPFEGGDNINPVPNPPAAPPYNTINYLPPYSLSNVLGGVPMSIDSHNGVLTALPDQVGQFVYAICVKEYRNGIYIGETVRDFQVNVSPCRKTTLASIFSPTISCGSLEAVFVNDGYNASSYLWDFGDLTVTTDTSTLTNPSYNYPFTGHFDATLIAYSPLDTLCNDTTHGDVYVYPPYQSEIYFSNSHCSAEFNFSDASQGGSAGSQWWSWDLGDNQSCASSQCSHIYSAPGNYEVKLISAADSGCWDTSNVEITVLPTPLSRFEISVDTCSKTVEVVSTSSEVATFHWDFGDGTNEFKNRASHTFQNDGSFTISLTVHNDSLCFDQSEVQVVLPPFPEADFRYSVAECDSVVYFSNLSRFASAFHWDFGDNNYSTQKDPVHGYDLSGRIPVVLCAATDQGCIDTLKSEVYFVSTKEAKFEAVLDSCSGNILFPSSTANAAYYFWDFGDGFTTTDRLPIHRYTENGSHRILLIVNRETACIDSVENFVNVENPLGEKIFIPNSFTPNGDGVNDYFTASIYRPCAEYELSIFSRWGDIVYQTSSPGEMKWDGTRGGEPLPQDVYVYILKNNNNTINGYINLMR